MAIVFEAMPFGPAGRKGQNRETGTAHSGIKVARQP
jgi:hypothetical protein